MEDVCYEKPGMSFKSVLHENKHLLSPFSHELFGGPHVSSTVTPKEKIIRIWIFFWRGEGFLNMELPFERRSLLFTFLYCMVSVGVHTLQSRGPPVCCLFLKQVCWDQLKFLKSLGTQHVKSLGSLNSQVGSGEEETDRNHQAVPVPVNLCSCRQL